MTPLKTILLLKSQARVIRSKAAALLSVGGNGCGKTETLALFAYLQSRNYPGNYGCVAAPSLPQLRRAALLKINAFFQERVGLTEGRHYVFNKVSNEFHFLENDSRFFLLGIEHVSREEIEGSELGWIAVDEIAGISFDKYQALASRVRKPGTSRQIRLFGYPPSPSHWTYERFVERNEPGDEIVQASTRENLESNNGFLPDDYLANLEKMYKPGSPLHERKVEGRFAQMEGLVYPEFTRDMVLKSEDDLPENDDGSLNAYSWVYGLDFGFKNPLCFLAAFTDGPDPSTNTIYIVGEHYQAGWKYADHFEPINELYRGGPIHADHDAQGQEELAELGIPTINARKGVAFGIDCVRVRLAEKRIKFLNCPNLIKEFGLYKYPDDNGRGRESPDAPLKRDDHAMDALRYLVVGEEFPAETGGFNVRMD